MIHSHRSQLNYSVRSSNFIVFFFSSLLLLVKCIGIIYNLVKANREDEFMRNKRRIFLVLMLMAITSCMATRFSDVWVDDTYQKGPIKDILVIAILPKPEGSKMVEEEMARQLKSRGVNSILGSVEFPGKPPSREDVISRLGNLGVDAVLVTTLTGKESKSYQDYPDDYKAILKQWVEAGRALPEAVTPVAVERQNYAFLRTNLFDAETQKIIWSALTETWIVGMDSRLSSSFVSTILEKLADNKLIK